MLKQARLDGQHLRQDTSRLETHRPSGATIQEVKEGGCLLRSSPPTIHNYRGITWIPQD